jgi:hypothetical protein
MRQHPVLNRENSHRGFGMLDKKRIIPNAKAKNNIEITTFIIQNRCLADRIAHGLTKAGKNLIFIRKRHVIRAEGSAHAAGRYHFKPLIEKQVGKKLGLLGQSNTKCQPYLPVPLKPGIQNRFLDTRELSIVLPGAGHILSHFLIFLFLKRFSRFRKYVCPPDGRTEWRRFAEVTEKTPLFLTITAKNLFICHLEFLLF